MECCSYVRLAGEPCCIRNGSLLRLHHSTLSTKFNQSYRDFTMLWHRNKSRRCSHRYRTAQHRIPTKIAWSALRLKCTAHGYLQCSISLYEAIVTQRHERHYKVMQ
uniref:Uncharacterized protein n=1 Tax=Rhipicephalus microplus TaxID=6941 RepID=A0A6G5AGT2_RHIMP